MISSTLEAYSQIGSTLPFQTPATCHMWTVLLPSHSIRNPLNSWCTGCLLPVSLAVCAICLECPFLSLLPQINYPFSVVLVVGASIAFLRSFFSHINIICYFSGIIHILMYYVYVTFITTFISEHNFFLRFSPLSVDYLWIDISVSKISLLPLLLVSRFYSEITFCRISIL